MPNRIDIRILDDGIKTADLETLQGWGNFFAPESKFDKRAVSTSQIRKFFGEIKRIQADFTKNSAAIVLLDPKIAYAVGRAKKENRDTKLIDFYAQLSPLIRDIKENKTKFSNFVNIVEAIVAYHKAAGGQ